MEQCWHPRAFPWSQNRTGMWTNGVYYLCLVTLTVTVMNLQRHEIHLGSNCLGPFLFTHYLLPVLKQTAAVATEASVRIVWTSSLFVETYVPKDGLIKESESPGNNHWRNYTLSKVGNWFLASEFGKRYEEQNIISIVSVASTLSPASGISRCCLHTDTEPWKSQNDDFTTISSLSDVDSRKLEPIPSLLQTHTNRLCRSYSSYTKRV